MENDRVAAFQLHRDVESAVDPGSDRMSILSRVLLSQNLAVIRRIPECFNPLTDDEKDVVVLWAKSATRDEDISKRDFTFHLLVNCGVSAEKILAIAESHPTRSMSALEHLRALTGGQGDVQMRLNTYFREIAEELIREQRIPSRDRGRHMLMTAAITPAEWQGLADRFTEREFDDLRQLVLERYLEECPDDTALTTFARKVADQCQRQLQSTTKCEREEATHMHWILTCLDRIGDNEAKREAAMFFHRKFNSALPHSVLWRISDLIPPPQPTRPSPNPFNRSIRPSAAPRKYEPGTVREALNNGWTIRKESGKQVVLVKDGRSITRYRE